MKKIFLSLLLSSIAFAGLPPTSTKDSADSSYVTTFSFAFPNFTGTHTGTVFSLGVNGIAGGGTNNSTAYTAGSVIFSNGTSLTQDNAALFWNDGSKLFEIGGGLQLLGSSSGYVEQLAPSTVTSYNITWPNAQGGANTTVVNNGSGALTWTSFPSPYIVSTISSNTNAVASTTYLCNTSGGAFTLTLPAPVSGAFVAVKDSTGSFGTNQLTVAPNGGEMIEGLAASKVLYTNWGAWSFFSDGTNWFMGPF